MATYFSITIFLGISVFLKIGLFDIIPIVKPIRTKEMIEKLNHFISSMKEKVLFAYKNPNNEYRKIFAPYRDLQEPLVYLISKKGARPFPDCFAIREANNEDSPEFWGEDIKTIKKRVGL